MIENQNETALERGVMKFTRSPRKRSTYPSNISTTEFLSKVIFPSRS